jgi:hypothetical protein
MNEEIYLSIVGLGIIMYSPFALLHISEGEDYLTSNYILPERVLEHVYRGTIVGFGTGSPGDYVLKFKEGYPVDEQVLASEFKLALGIEVRDAAIVVRDLYDLMDWRSSYPEEQVVHVANGFYHVTLLGNVPSSGILGDDQEIDIYLNKLEKFPALRYGGVPMFSE